jgi:hypothetical protein
VKDTKQKWVKSKPNVPNIWPMKIGTNLTRKETLALENACIHLPQLANMSPRRLFKSKVLFDVASYLTPTFLDDHPNTR